MGADAARIQRHGDRRSLTPPRSPLLTALPNLISLARLLAVPLAVWLIIQDRYGLAFWVFAAYIAIWGWRIFRIEDTK